MIKHAVVGDVIDILMELHDGVRDCEDFDQDTLEWLLRGLTRSILKLQKVGSELYNEYDEEWKKDRAARKEEGD